MKAGKRKKTGLPPGSVIFTGKRKVEKISIHYLEYDDQTIDDQVLNNQTITDFHTPTVDYIQWYDIRGLHDTELIAEIGRLFQVHTLILEDIVDVGQRPKLEELDQGLFITLKAISFDVTRKVVLTEQVAFYVGDGFLLSFQEDQNDLFGEIRGRLLKSNGKIRSRNVDYLLYALIDLIVDKYFIALDLIEEQIELLEYEIAESFSTDKRATIYQLKQEMITVRKTTGPLRELLNIIIKTDHFLVADTTERYFRDLRDHVIQIIDLVETYRENLNSLQDLFLSEMSHRTNSVMQVLTIVSTIFIPLTFLAGIYGMNFDHIPELQWPNGYFILLGVMLVIVVGMITFFRRKGWF